MEEDTYSFEKANEEFERVWDKRFGKLFEGSKKDIKEVFEKIINSGRKPTKLT